MRQAIEMEPESRFGAFELAVLSGLTLMAVFIHGYHPYAEDGGIYLPGIFRQLDPTLYPTWTGFVTAQSNYSHLAFVVASIVRLSGVNVLGCILVVYIIGIWIDLYAAWRILALCCRSTEACYAGVSILALCLTVPIAGTSLILVDPYVTARSISTPCSLLAIAGALDLITYLKQTRRARLRSLLLCVLSLFVAALMHLLMAAYATGCVVLLMCSSISRPKLRNVALGAIAVLCAAVAGILNLVAPVQPDGYANVALSRYYWFLSQWHWYEIVGLIAPLILLCALSRYSGFKECGRWLTRMSISAGLIGLTVSLLYAHEPSRSYFVAMLQPLRIFQIVYIVMILLCAAVLAELLLERKPWRWAAALVPLGLLMLLVQIQTFPHSSHLEFPWSSLRNDWERGFLWIRDNTPPDTLFALDAKYILIAGEDAQNFRAIARRSALPDYQKDGGIASIAPNLTSEWIKGQSIQSDLAIEGDDQRRSKLTEAGVRWLVLPSDSVTAFPCPYQNNSMKVCRVPDL